LADLEAKHPNMIKKETIGKSIEGRDITRYIIHSPGAVQNKPSVYIEALQHAR
jgi:murein tripeptide amidase MpaA